MSWLSRVANVFRSSGVNRALDDEITFHIESRIDEIVAEGITRKEAEVMARRQFGKLLRVRESSRDVKVLVWLDDLARDVRHGLRSLWRTPIFACVAILTLALGIGANSAIFTVINGVLLEPLPYEAHDRQVRLRVTLEGRNGVPDQRPLTLTSAATRELAERARIVDGAGNITLSLVNWPGREPRWSGGAVTASVFPMLGVTPVLGRLFVPEDELDGAPAVIILSHETWQRHFGGDPNVLGRTITLEPALTTGRAAVDPQSYAIIGVTPPGFQYLPGGESAFWIPIRRSGSGFVVARLAEGVTPPSAAARIQPIVRELLKQQPGPPVLDVSVVGLHEQLVAPVRPALLVLMGAVGLVLLIACVNVANLLLGRSVSRQREIAIRSALGAGRLRIVRFMVTESLLLTAGAAIFGVALALGGVRLLGWLATTADRIDLGQGGGRMLPRLDAISVDGSVLMFTVVVAVAVGTVFGLGCALQQLRNVPNVTVRNGSGATGVDGAPRFGIRNALVVAEIALSIVLLVGAGLLMTSFVKLLRVDVGYEPNRVLTFQVSLPSERYRLPVLQRFTEDLTSSLRSMPGVLAASYANQLPLVQLIDTLALGRTPDPQRQLGAGGDIRIVSHEYFRTLGIRLIAGRTFDERDGAGQPRSLILNEALARRDFGGSANAVGQQVYVWRDTTPWTVVGVVGNVRQFGLAQPPDPQFFIDARQWGEGLSPLFPLGPYYMVRYDGDDRAVLAAVQTALQGADAEGVLFNVASMNDVISTTVARNRMYTVLLALFAALGVVMALVGVYGVMSYSVSQRTRELGIRMALGAHRRAVLGLVFQQSLVVTALGLALGLLGAAGVTRFLETMLFGVTPLDPLTFASVSVSFAFIAMLAAFVPARRATLVDPLVALRTE